MATAESVKNKIQGLISQANEATGNTDTDLTAAVGSLIAGFGQGGGDNSSFISVLDKTVTELTLPEGLVDLKLTFSGFLIKKVSFPSTLETIANSVFQYVDAIEGHIVFPAKLKSIGTRVFYTCWKITGVTFNGTVESIGSDAFGGCNKLTTINVPWAEGEVEGAPWGATSATINYNYTGEG